MKRKAPDDAVVESPAEEVISRQYRGYPPIFFFVITLKPGVE
jgi:hypothetical protein